ncbi:MAG: NAD(P)H-binding protein [Propionibacteriaceae bacterium]
MTVLVTGVRGRVGSLVAAELAAHGIRVRGGSSHVGGVERAASAHLGVPTVAVDLRTATGLEAALDGVDRVFLYAAADAIEEVTRAFVAAGVAHVVVLSSASVEMAGGGALGRHHEQVEQSVVAAGLGWTFLRPNAFATNTLRWADGVRAGRVALPFPDAYVEPIHEADLADAAVAALTDERHLGRSYYLTGGVSMTQRQQIATIAAAVGHEVVVEELDPQEWRRQLLRRGTLDSVADALISLWSQTLDGPGRHDGRITDVTGAEPRTYAQWVADHGADFR